MTKNAEKAIGHLRTAWKQLAADGYTDANRAAMALIDQAIAAAQGKGEYDA